MNTLSNRRNMLRFTLPVALENMLTLAISMVVSALVGRLSGSALVAVGLANSMIALLLNTFSLFSTGGAVLLARSIGAGDWEGSSRIAEQNILMTLLSSLAMAVLFYVGANSCMKLLARNAEETLLQEAVAYFRLMMVSFPVLMISTVGSSLLRASGNSRGPLLANTALNLTQVLASYVLIQPLNLGVAGAGWSYVIARTVGAAIIAITLLRSHVHFHIQLRRLIRPNFSIWKRIMRIGLPTTMEDLLIQGGYVLANSLAVGLGTRTASVYQVVNTLYSFAAYPQNITLAVMISFVGQYLGANDEDGARRIIRRAYILAVSAQTLLSFLIALGTGYLAPLFTTDSAVVAESRTVVWAMFLTCIPAISINTINPSMRAGGDTRYTMMESILGVWLIRVPLTWLLCYPLSMGAAGVFLANAISLFARATSGLLRYRSGRWIHKRV